MTRKEYLSLTTKKDGTPIERKTLVEGFVVERISEGFLDSQYSIIRFTRRKGTKMYDQELIGTFSFCQIYNRKFVDLFDKKVRETISIHYISKGKDRKNFKYYLRDNPFGFLFGV